jgi:hypothetical protein
MGIKNDDLHNEREMGTSVDPDVATKSPDIKAMEKLGRAVEFTRLNRIHASNRLITNESFVQGINIYYSCASAIVTVLSLIFPQKNYGIVSALLTVILAISIVYLNAQKYGSRAQQLQSNFIALQQLHYEILAAVDANDANKRESLETKYIELLKTSENHNQHDHKHTLYQQDKIDRAKAKKKGEPLPNPRLKGYEKLQFWFVEIGFLAIKIVMWSAPVVYFILTICGII